MIILWTQVVTELAIHVSLMVSMIRWFVPRLSSKFLLESKIESIFFSALTQFAQPKYSYEQLLEGIHNFAAIWTQSFLQVN